MENISYAFGMIIGQNLKNSGIKEIDGASFLAAVEDVLRGAKTRLSDAEADKMVSEFFEAEKAKIVKAAREDGEKFLAENASKEGVVVLPSGLQYKVLEQGSGKKPAATDQVKCHYEGTLIDGTVFDSSYKRNAPATFPLDGVIKGWTEGVQLMNEGSKFRFFIPYDLAYGEHGAGQMIPPYAALIFDVELIEVL